MNQPLRSLIASTALALLGVMPATAQQITGTPGSPSATTTIDGNYIPNPPPAFGGDDQPQFDKLQAVVAAQISSRPRARPTSC